jgi:CRISPR-associated exonuclease Cas4
MVEITYRDDKVSHIFPVEYKYGKRKQADHDDIQLAAQVLCLEYMFKIEISQGAIYHISSRHRREVEIDRNLRSKLLHVVNEVRLLFSQKHSPAPAADQRCRHCAQSDSCLPFAAQKLHPNNYL